MILSQHLKCEIVFANQSSKIFAEFAWFLFNETVIYLFKLFV